MYEKLFHIIIDFDDSPVVFLYQQQQQQQSTTVCVIITLKLGSARGVLLSVNKYLCGAGKY